jgi:hypothetical protein
MKSKKRLIMKSINIQVTKNKRHCHSCLKEIKAKTPILVATLMKRKYMNICPDCIKQFASNL